MRDLAIAYGRSRQALTWVNKKIRFADLKERLKVTIRTPESVEEYAKMSRAQRDAAKDHGGFVAGVLIGGRRKMDTVELRSMIALDGDKIDQDFLDNYESIMPYTSALYTTHSSTEENPRARIVIPATRDMTPEEFVAVTRCVAQSLGIDFFDECSYQPNQLMYWPSTPANGTFVYKETDGAWLNPDTILAAHPEWRDPMRLPTSSRESKANTTSQRKAQDPLTKEGAVGLFNRTYYPITTALDTFLSDIYEPTDRDNRYHLIEASSMAGVEVIEDKFVYSHHAKDPAYLQLCNAFDIVRIHRFGDLGEKESYKAMCDFAMQQESVRLLATNERLADASEEFTAEDDESWKTHLELDRSGAIKNTLGNLTLILQNDPALKSIGFNQLADGMEIRGSVPWKHPAKFWRDADDAQLISYIDSHYGNFSARNYDIAITKVTDDRSYHPIHEMFESLPEWDHVERVDTLLIDYLGAQDNEYTRAITRKILCAAYRRVYEPGVKFDYAVVLNGPQGIGKSTLIAHLGMEWFSDSLSLSDMNDKTAAEKLQGYWIMEIGELAGMKKADIDKVKAFISRQDDKYRASFGRRVTPHLRQCVFFGTTNSDNGYLRDVTGNRRFWNVKVTGEGKWKPWDLDAATVQQIWAETVLYAKAGERLFLSPELEEYAREEQREALEMDDREGIVREYLDMLLPADWDTMDIYRRREYFREPSDPTRPIGVKRRDWVCNLEIWCECFGKNKEDFDSRSAYPIASIMARIEGWAKDKTQRVIRPYGKQRVYKRTR